MIFSKATEYAIRALAYMARQPAEKLCALQDIAHHEGIPPDFLRKVLNELRRRRLLCSVKGIHGGYRLARSPKTVSLWEVFQLLEPHSPLDACVLGVGECGQGGSCCPLHYDWLKIRSELIHMLKSKTIHQIAANVSTRGVEGEELC